MDKIRVLVVDDSALIRKLVSGVLGADPGIEIVGTAPNGRIALAKIAETRPDLVTLDIEMPEMDGLATLRELRKQHPSLPVIILSSHTERGASSTIDCLFLGARDYVTKPSGMSQPGAGQARLREDLIPKIKALCPPSSVSTPRSSPALPHPASRSAASEHAPRLLVIGASTGGPNALTDLLTGMPQVPAAPILIAQHMPPLFTRMLAERLAAKTGLGVREAEDGELLAPGAVRIAPGDFHLELAGGTNPGRLRVFQAPPENSCRPSVDVLFRSAARECGAGVLGVILTGMGHDGLRGARAIREAGGHVLVQDEASSVVWGMPGAVVREGLADSALPPQLLRGEVLRRFSQAPAARAGTGGPP